jgi:hypothetical protein
MFGQTRVTKTLLIAIISFFTIYSTVQAGVATTEDLSQKIPAKTLFYIRVNNLNQTLTQIDKFAGGSSPDGISMLAKTQIKRLLGSSQLAGLNMDGNFAIFGTATNPTSNIAIGVLVPVTDYNQFITGISNNIKPDDKGIAKITKDGNDVMLITQSGNYALITSPSNYEQLVAIKTEISSANSTGIGSVLNTEQLMQATSSPMWVYGNMQQAAQTFGHVILAGLNQMKETVAKSGANDVNLPTDMYIGIIDSFIQQSPSLRFTVNPQPAVLNITGTLRSLPQTDIKTASNVTVIGKTADEQLIVNVAVPREHIQEIMTSVLSTQQQTPNTSQASQLKQTAAELKQVVNSQRDAQELLKAADGPGAKESQDKAITYLQNALKTLAKEDTQNRQLQMQEQLQKLLSAQKKLSFDTQDTIDLADVNAIDLEGAAADYNKQADTQSQLQKQLEQTLTQIK